MQIVITAAGLGSRFASLNLQKPKYLISVFDHVSKSNKTLFELALRSLGDFFDFKNTFYFVFLKKDQRFQEDIKSLLKKLQIANYHICYLDTVTSGQAASVMAISDQLQTKQSVLVYNIDTMIYPGVIEARQLVSLAASKGYQGILYTTKIADHSTHWSFVLPKPNDQSQTVIQVTEKKRISDYCCIGLYYFASFELFASYYFKVINEVIKANKEAYIAPMYQHMINDNVLIGYINIDTKHFFCLGTIPEISSYDPNFLDRNK